MLRPHPLNRGVVTATLAAVAGLALWIPLAWPLATARVFHGDDLGSFHLPLRQFYAQCLASGDDYRWHPGLYCGFYVHGEGQAGMAHPLHLALYRWLAIDVALQLEIVIGYPLMALGMALWLRRLDLCWGAAILGGVVFAFSPFNLLRYVHPNAIQVIAHLPWLLLGVEILAKPRGHREARAAFAGLGLLTASQCLLGYPQYVGLSLLAEGSYAACRLGRSGAAWRRWLAAKGLGFLAGAPQILPHWDALRSSVRHAPSIPFLAIDSLHPLNLLQILAPELFKLGHYRDDGPAGWPRHERVAYLGAMVPASLAWLWIRRGHLRRWRPVILWSLLLGGVSTVLALGGYSPLFVLYAKLPLIRLFRATNRFVVLTQLAGSTLNAVAVHDVMSVSRHREKFAFRSLRPLAIPSILGLASSALMKLLAHFLPGWSGSDQVDAMRGLVASFAWISLPALLFALAARGRPGAIAAMVLVAAVDPAIHALKPLLEHDRPASLKALAGPTPPGEPGTRVVGALNAATASGTRLMGGYVALSPRRELDPEDSTSRRIAGVSWIWSQDAWSPSPSPFPRARLVARTLNSHDVRDDLARIDPATIALIDRDRTFPAGATGSAQILLDRPGRIRIRTEASAPRLLVVSEAHHPGWVVRIGGKVLPIVRAYGDFLGCEVGPGVHDVNFRFDPASDRLGVQLGWVGLITLVLVTVSLPVSRAWRHPKTWLRGRQSFRET